ncbi:alpha/beta fold hydrolase [Haloplasma contractile]|uniref:Proline iminopeptidase protein n=1 Tax=Haloplasma contractile SSD-17B TaxID=1033810 RepID=U2DRE0_9MOLU|nr:alpha/beta hydrolase [Haloplasma contractile]ERJ11142.1 proline iminopeptidase protein [Haloplasma contractile SSD-17B]
MKFIKTEENVKICVHDYSHNGTPIIFLHRLEGNAKEWTGVISHLKKEYDIVSLDLRGHGKSSKPNSGYHIDRLALDVKVVMDQLKIKQAHLVGNELGSKVAISLAANYKSRVLSIVCIGSVRNFFGKYGLYDLKDSESIQNQKKEILTNINRRTLPKKDNKEELMTHLKLLTLDEGKDFNTFRHRFYEYEVAQDEAFYYTLSCKNHVIREVTKQLFDIDFEHYFLQVDCPILFMPSDEEDELTHVTESIRHFATYISPSYVRVIEFSEFLDAAFDFPEEVSKEMIAFYKKI